MNMATDMIARLTWKMRRKLIIKSTVSTDV